MGTPRDPIALKFFRVAKQRLGEADLILDRLGLSAVSVYLAGYAIEYGLKALIVERTAPGKRGEVQRFLKDQIGHDLNGLRECLVRRKVHIPARVSGTLLSASTWSPALRYEPGLGDPREASKFLNATKIIVEWVERSV